MKNKNSIYLALLGLLIHAACHQESSSTFVTHAPTPTFCHQDWFPHSQTPNPKEGDGSTFDTNSTTMSIFHEWAWQKFLWLTRPATNNKALFEQQLILVNDVVAPIPTHLDNNGNTIPLVLLADSQAGKDSMGILISNPNFNTQGISDTVYYAIYVDSSFFKTAQTMRKAIRQDTSKLNNDYTFPIGAMEVKTSWIKAEVIPSELRSKYYITKAYFPNKNSVAEVALLGMHIASVVKNHPEFIWATFEHQELAPIYPWPNTKTSQDIPVTVEKEFLLFRKGDTSTINNLQKQDSFQSVFAVYQYGIPITQQDTFLETSQREPQNYNHINSVNACVKSNLKDEWSNYFYNGAVWLKTDKLSPQQQVDTINSLAKKLGNFSKPSIARGSANASNITMETFQQVKKEAHAIHNIDVNLLKNCFSCHHATMRTKQNTFQSPLYISHIFKKSLKDSLPLSAKEQENIQGFISQ
ncbi:MAG: hypothetical protein ACRBFS_14305 [Aureispira sp.]